MTLTQTQRTTVVLLGSWMFYSFTVLFSDIDAVLGIFTSLVSQSAITTVSVILK